MIMIPLSNDVIFNNILLIFSIIIGVLYILLSPDNTMLIVQCTSDIQVSNISTYKSTILGNIFVDAIA